MSDVVLSSLERLTEVLIELLQVSDVFLSSLERLTVLLIEHYPKLSKKLHFICFVAILKVMYALAPKGAVFKVFLSHVGKTRLPAGVCGVVYVHVLYTCTTALEFPFRINRAILWVGVYDS